MHLPDWLRSTLAAGLFILVLAPACSSAPADDGGDEGTTESALSGCGTVGPGGVIVGRAPNACVPGTVDHSSAGCAQRNGLRTRKCGADCRYQAYSSTCACTPSCAGRSCGDDGCGGSCGTCASSQSCDSAGTCHVSYSGGGGTGSGSGSCAGKNCGSDGAGGSCGTCGSGSICVAGTCTAPTTCTANGASCFTDGQCCSSNCYAGPISTTCVSCKPNTSLAYCLKDSECCSGLCDTYYGSCVGVCKHTTAACTNSSQCCSGLCSSGSCK